VDKDEEGVPFLIGDVIKIVTGTEPLEIHWFSPAVKRSGVGGKWTADFMPGGVKPSVECRQRDLLPSIPVPNEIGFINMHSGKLTKESAILIEEWIDTWEALEWDEQSSELEGKPDVAAHKRRRSDTNRNSKRSSKRHQ
jgi:hypothetical protein